MNTISKAMAIALFAGCGSTSNPKDAGREVHFEDSGFSFDGNASYCISHRDDVSTCLKLYAGMRINSQDDISKAWLNVYREGRDAARVMEQDGDGNSMHYKANSELCIRGSAIYVTLIAEDESLNQGELPIQEVDCKTLDNMLKQ